MEMKLSIGFGHVGGLGKAANCLVLSFSRFSMELWSLGYCHF